MSNWNDLSPKMRIALGGPDVGQLWSGIPEEEQQIRINEAKKVLNSQKASGVPETPSQRKARKATERAARAKERADMRKGIIKASGGSVKKKYAYGGRVARYKK